MVMDLSLTYLLENLFYYYRNVTFHSCHVLWAVLELPEDFFLGGGIELT